MVMRIVVAALASMVMAVQADPIPLFNTHFDTLAVALAESAVDVQSGSSPPDTRPLSTNAIAVGSTDLATADAFADSGFLSASTTVFALTGVADAVTQTNFSGTFNNGFATLLTFRYDNTNLSTGTGSAEGLLAITLTSGGQTLISQVLTSSGTFNFTFARPVGTTSTLDVTLVSQASALGAAGNSSDAFNFGTGVFAVSVPLPPTWPLLLLGLAALGAVQRGSQKTGRRS